MGDGSIQAGSQPAQSKMKGSSPSAAYSGPTTGNSWSKQALIGFQPIQALFNIQDFSSPQTFRWAAGMKNKSYTK